YRRRLRGGRSAPGARTIRTSSGRRPGGAPAPRRPAQAPGGIRAPPLEVIRRSPTERDVLQDVLLLRHAPPLPLLHRVVRPIWPPSPGRFLPGLLRRPA